MGSSESVEAAVAASIPSETAEALVEVVRTAHEIVRRRHHDPNIGCDGQTYGLLVYKVVTKSIRDLATNNPELGIIVLPCSQEFRFRIGQFLLAVHSLGWDATDDISHSFPNNHGAAGELANANIQLSLELGPDIYVPKALILGHQGNAETGCQAVWLGEPLETSAGGRIAKWGFTTLLRRWKTPSQEQLAEEAELHDVVLKLKKDPQSKKPQSGKEGA